MAKQPTNEPKVERVTPTPPPTVEQQLKEAERTGEIPDSITETKTVTKEEAADIAKEHGVTKEQIEALVGTGAGPETINEDKQKETPAEGANKDLAAEVKKYPLTPSESFPPPATGEKPEERKDVPAPRQTTRQELRQLTDDGYIDVNEKGYIDNRTGQILYL